MEETSRLALSENIIVINGLLPLCSYVIIDSQMLIYVCFFMFKNEDSHNLIKILYEN